MQEELTPELVLYGYRMGVFPMAEDTGDIYWYNPDPRCIFEFDRFHIPHGLRPIINRKKFEIRLDTAFDRIIRACADRDEGTWISDDIRAIYSELHHQGHAHTVEAWLDGQLAGGLYGIAIGGAFFGESMFHNVTDASKVALVALVDHLKTRGFALLDTQWSTPHLERFGSVEIPQTEYLKRLGQALKLDCTFVDTIPPRDKRQ